MSSGSRNNKYDAGSGDVVDVTLKTLDKNCPRKYPNEPKYPIIYRGTDLIYIQKQAKTLFRPHGLPAQIAKIPNLVSYTDALKLREICKQVREQHWSYICLRKLQFREKVWKIYHVERIPCGPLRKSFADSFETYLPEKSHFPIVRENALPW